LRPVDPPVREIHLEGVPQLDNLELREPGLLEEKTVNFPAGRLDTAFTLLMPLRSSQLKSERKALGINEL
jgi:hypothetical protein